MVENFVLILRLMNHFWLRLTGVGVVVLNLNRIIVWVLLEKNDKPKHFLL